VGLRKAREFGAPKVSLAWRITAAAKSAASDTFATTLTLTLPCRRQIKPNWHPKPSLKRIIPSENLHTTPNIPPKNMHPPHIIPPENMHYCYNIRQENLHPTQSEAAMLARKITLQLEEWRKLPSKKCLLIEGARQVGKTFAIRQFGKANYDNFIEINFELNPAFVDIFAGSLEIDEITAQISLIIPQARFSSGKTLIFLDEIQSCPRARTALKFFTEDGRYDVIASGSLLGIHYKEVPSYPVGYETHVQMYGLDFEEFLWARGVTPQNISYLRKCFDERRAVPQAMHEKMMRLFREYIVIGGMPEVVQVFATTNNFAQALTVQRDILQSYKDDIAKYAPGQEKAKAKACFESIPRQLSRDYKKFSYSVVESKAGARKYAGSLQWLNDAHIVNYCFNLSRPALPLEGNVIENTFKVYMADTGLLVAMLEDGAQKAIIDGNLGIYKGAIYENIVSDIFAKAGKKLYYFERNSSLEIDFILNIQGSAVGVEVKSASNRKAKSLNSLIQNHGAAHGIKLSPANVGADGNIETLPLYMAMFL
jgi:hypothetical protein